MSKPMHASEFFASPSCAGAPGLEVPGGQRRNWFRTHLEQSLPAGLSPDEVEAHLVGMPEHYWQRVSEPDLRWGLETIHGFFRQIAALNVPPSLPFVSSRQSAGQDSTQVMLCTWDRQGLLAKAAAAFSAVRLNILQADVFTRLDNVVLDTFTVTEFDGARAATPARLEEMTFLLEGALSEPPRFASLWACSSHRFLAPPGPERPVIRFDNESSPTGTVIHLEAPDRLNLLYDLLEALAQQGLIVTSARIETSGKLARDRIHITDGHGRKVSDPERLAALGRDLESALRTPE
jgi:[protein-PII] uridylyltransferase